MERVKGGQEWGRGMPPDSGVFGMVVNIMCIEIGGLMFIIYVRFVVLFMNFCELVNAHSLDNRQM